MDAKLELVDANYLFSHAPPPQFHQCEQLSKRKYICTAARRTGNYTYGEQKMSKQQSNSKAENERRGYNTRWPAAYTRYAYRETLTNLNGFSGEHKRGTKNRSTGSRQVLIH